MKKFLGAAAACAAIFTLYADGVLPQPGTWRTAVCENTTAAVLSGNAVVGLQVKQPIGAKRFFYSAEKDLLPVRCGDFTATFKLHYDMYDGDYSGETYLQLLDANDGLIAQAGLNDRWGGAKGNGRASGNTLWECGAGNKVFPPMPFKGTITYRIERKGHDIAIFANNIKLHERIGSTFPVAKVRLFFQEYRGKTFHPASFEYADIEVKSDLAAKSADVFEDLPTADFAPEWKVVERVNADGLVIDKSNGELTVIGFLNPAKDAKDLYRCTLERSVGKVEGDFTAALNLKWSLPVLNEYYCNNFMGEVMLQVLDVNGKLMAETGLLDNEALNWARAAAYIGGERKGGAIALQEKLDEQFMIRRTGKKFDIYLGAWHLDSLEGSAEAVGKIRLVFQQNLVDKNGKAANTLFAPFTVRRIAMGKSALPAPRSNVEPICRINSKWQLTKPIIAYWAGPMMSEEFARELADGGWNQAWGRNVFDLDIMYRHGLRGHIWMSIDPDNEDNIRRLKLWLDSLRKHPALHFVHCNDEPIPNKNMHLAELKVNFVRKYAPELGHFNNMHPFDATYEALGYTGKGGPADAYNRYIDEYSAKLNPVILSFDRYHFSPGGDNGGQFANFALVRNRAMQLNIPYMAILQTCSWVNWRRPARPNEYYYLANIALAYGYKGLSSYVYGTVGHWGAMRDLNTNKTTAMYEATRRTNREFFSIASELFNLKSLGVYHTGEIPYMGVELPADGVFQLEHKLKNVSQGLTEPKHHRAAKGDALNNAEPVKGYLLGYFGPKDGQATHVMVVNLDYDARTRITIAAPSNLERFEPHQKIWYPANSNKAELNLPAGGGALLRLAADK